MKHRPQDYTDMDLDVALASDHAPMEFVVALEAEKLRRIGEDQEALETLRVHLNT